jgi:hypothetical protein
MMNKKLMIGAIAGFAVATGIVALTKRDTEPKPTMWDKMRKGMEEMPEDFPPRIMFDNLEATKANTERILTLLESEDRRVDDAEVMALS